MDKYEINNARIKENIILPPLNVISIGCDYNECFNYRSFQS